MKKVSQETADQVFRDCDIDKDNRVSLREFRTMLETKNKITKGCQQTDFEVWGPKVNTEFFEKKGIFKRMNSREGTKLTNTRSIPLNPSRSRTRLDGILLRSSTTKKQNICFLALESNLSN